VLVELQVGETKGCGRVATIEGSVMHAGEPGHCRLSCDPTPWRQAGTPTVDRA
jgi:hypothetical protein